MALAVHAAGRRQAAGRAPRQHGQTRLRTGAERQFYTRRQMDHLSRQFRRQFPGLCCRGREIFVMERFSQFMSLLVTAALAESKAAKDCRTPGPWRADGNALERRKV